MTKTNNDEKKNISRRSFLKGSTLIATGAAIGLGTASAKFLKSDRKLLRPPGALDEDMFLASCIKCGQCLQVCPPQVVILADIRQGFGIGTPYVIPQEGACILCAGLPCVLACPTGALDHHISLGKDAEMGLAVITGSDTCLSVQGQNDLVYRLNNVLGMSLSSAKHAKIKEILLSFLKRLSEDEKKTWKSHFALSEFSEKNVDTIFSKITTDDLDWFANFVKSSSQAKKSCQICLDECPIKEEGTIRFIAKNNTADGQQYLWPSVTKTCVGCGVCEEKCPTPLRSITITPRLRLIEKPTAHQTGEGQS
ncbi:MAG: 4Fe-4S dicluster domain-containing protein [Desulfobulbaceae bacterium]|nr:4Fe-4S dicluster domain-containing protein [Desulfobulbaceae bacterium]